MARILHSVPAPPPSSTPAPTLKTVPDSQPARRFAVGLVGAGGVPAGLAQQVSAAVGGNVQPVPTNLDQVNDSPSFVRLLASHAVANVSYNFRGVWDASYSYVTGDEVVHGSDYWMCLTPNSDSAPGTGNADWQVVGSYSSYLGAWSSTTAYAVGAEVTNGGNFWVAVSANTNSAPTVTNSDWVMAGPTSAAAITYTDGSTVESLQPSEAGADVTADNTSKLTASLSNQTLDRLADGATYARVRAAQLRQNIVSILQSGRNAIFNPTFTSDALGIANGAEVASGAVIDGWSVEDASSETLAIPYNGTIRVRTFGTFSVGTAAASTAVVQSSPFAVQPSTPYAFKVDALAQSSSPILSGFTLSCVVQITFLDGTGSAIGAATQFGLPFASAGGTSYYTGTSPAGAASAEVQLYTSVTNSNSSSGAPVGGATDYFDFGLNAVEYVQATNLDRDAVDGVVNGRVAMSDVVPGSGGNRVGIGVAGSGKQLGDVRNAPPMFTANQGVGLSGLSISYGAATASSAVISTSAFSLVFGGAGEQVSIGYDALSVAVTGSGTETFYLWVNDPTWAGGAPTLNASTTPYAEMEQGGSIYLGNVAVTFASGSTGGGSASGGTGCPAVDQWVIRRGRFGLPRYVRAGDVRAGDFLRLSSRRWGRVSRSVREEQDCWAIGTRRGWALTCSATAPIQTRQGDRLPAKLSGHALPVKRWLRTLQDEALVSVPVGRRLVQHISIADPEHHFWCGATRGLMLAHHNMKPPA